MTKLLSSLLFAAFALFVATSAQSETVQTAAVFDTVLINSSPEPTTPQEQVRIARMTTQLKQALEKSGRYHVIDLAAIKKDIDAVNNISDCNGCEADLAKKAGAQVAVVSWVQKVSDLILNMNIRIVDAKTGVALKGGSVDIRGNDDLNWNHGLKYLLQEHVFGQSR